MRASELLRIVLAGSHAVLALQFWRSVFLCAIPARGKDITEALASVRMLACAPGLRFLPHA
jgi:hypothetical protein